MHTRFMIQLLFVVNAYYLGMARLFRHPSSATFLLIEPGGFGGYMPGKGCYEGFEAGHRG